MTFLENSLIGSVIDGDGYVNDQPGVFGFRNAWNERKLTTWQLMVFNLKSPMIYARGSADTRRAIKSS